MKIKLLRRIRRKAQYIFYCKLSTFETTNGKVTRIGYRLSYEWALIWLLGERLDYNKDRGKIVCRIARLLWKRKEREFWYGKLRPTAKGGAECGN